MQLLVCRPGGGGRYRNLNKQRRGDPEGSPACGDLWVEPVRYVRVNSGIVPGIYPVIKY